MDAQQFQRPTKPTFRPVLNGNVTEKAAMAAEVPAKGTEPIADQRYPQYAAVMDDGRLVTDYKSHCAVNVVPSKYGNSLRAWYQHNADALVQVSRKRQAERAGAQYSMAATVPGARQVQQCDPYECSFMKSTNPTTIGLERIEGVPPLFGTFSDTKYMKPASSSILTTSYEGGRNTPRGRQYVPLGNKYAFPNPQYSYN
jgi:hypothetical protein